MPQTTPCGTMATTALDPRPRPSRPTSTHKVHGAAGLHPDPQLCGPWFEANAVRYCSQLEFQRSVPPSVP